MNETTAPGTRPGAISAWFTVLMLCIAQVVSTIDRGMLALVVDPVRRDLGITDLQIAILQGFAFSFLYVIAGIAMGLVADVVNRKRLLMAGIAVWSAATLASGLAESFGHLFAARLFIGIGEAVLAPCAVTMIADLFPVSRRGKPMALYVFGSMIAFGIGSVITGFILEAAPQGVFDGIGFLEGRAPWRIAFILAGGFGLVLAAGFVPVKEPVRVEAKVMQGGSNSLRDSIGAMLGNLQIYLPFYLALALFGVGISVVFYWGPVLLARVFDYPVDQVSKMLGLGHIAWAVVGAVAAGVITDLVARRKGPVGLIGVSAVVSLLGIPTTLAVFAGNGTAAVVLLSGVTFASAIFGSAMLSVVAEVAPQRTRGLATALYAFFMTLIGASSGPLLVAYVTERIFGADEAVGLSIAIVGTLAFAACALFALIAAGNLRAWTDRRPETADSAAAPAY
ncbi:MAG: MFS transporter [Gammaproteobacteria bacterium]|nr:MFS transporter [Gammaproteobacteria bacterium]